MTEPAHQSWRLDRHDAFVEDQRPLLKRILLMEKTGDRTELAALLSGVISTMQGRFAREEASGGLYEAIAGAAPRLLARLGDLVTEHDALLDRARVLLRHLTENFDSPQEQLRARVRALAIQLRTHEDRDAALLTLALG